VIGVKFVYGHGVKLKVTGEKMVEIPIPTILNCDRQ